jgi:ribose transport system substrate-binding protein
MNKAKRTRATLGLALAALPLLLLGCNNNKGGAAASSSGTPATADAKIVKLGFVTNNPSQFWKIAEAGLRKYEK